MPENLAAALVAFQAAMPKLGKSAKADAGKYSYRYTPLDDIVEAAEPILAVNGLAFTCGPDFIGDLFVLRWRLLHVSGECLEGAMPLPAGAQPQTLGGTISYFRRYCFVSVLNVVADEDDDGQRAQDSYREDPDAWAAARPAPRRERAARDVAEPTLRTEAQSRRMFQLFNQGGVKDREQVLAFITELVGRPVDSTRTLTREEAGLVIASLEAAAAEKAGHDEQPA